MTQAEKTVAPRTVIRTKEPVEILTERECRLVIEPGVPIGGLRRDVLASIQQATAMIAAVRTMTTSDCPTEAALLNAAERSLNEAAALHLAADRAERIGYATQQPSNLRAVQAGGAA